MANTFDINTNDPSQLSQQSDALLFVKDLDTNNVLKQKWTSLLKKIKEKLPKGQDQKVYLEKLKIVDNFIAEQGYNTVASLILSMLKTSFYENYKKQSEANYDSDRFFQDILAQPKLLKGWQQALSKSSNTDRTAASKFLKDHGYNCTADQVSSSITKNRKKKIDFWTGIYGNSVVLSSDSSDKKAKAGPVLIVGGSISTVSVGENLLDTDLNNMTYKESILTWDKDDFSDDATSGKITFSQITRPSKNDDYVGNEFFGTITSYDSNGKTISTDSVMGRVGKPPKDMPAGTSGARQPKKKPPSVQPTAVQEAMKYLGYFMVGVFLVDFIASIPSRFNSIKDFVSKTKDKITGRQKEKLDESEKATDDSVSKINDEDSFDSSVGNIRPEGGGNTGDSIDNLFDEPSADEMDNLESNLEKINEENSEIEQEPDEVPDDPEVEEPDVEDPEASLGELAEEFV